MSNDNLADLPTAEELAAAREAKTVKREPVQYAVNSRPRVVRIDPVTNSELPPEMPAPADDDSDADRSRPRKRQADDDDRGIPDKFKGKTPGEIAASYVELERRFGSLANEVGHMRSMVERVASGKRKDDLGIDDDNDDDSVEITSEDLLNNPTEAIRKVASRSSDTKKLAQEIEQIRAERLMADFEKKHPTFQDDMNDPEFQKFVQASQYRQRLGTRAAEQGDLDAADELWTAWEEYSSTNDATNEDRDFDNEVRDVRQRNTRDLHLERGGNRGGGNAGFHKKTYRAADLVNLRLNDPDRYYSDEMQEIITRAYAEGRVK